LKLQGNCRGHASPRCRYPIVAGEYHAALLSTGSVHVRGIGFIRDLSVMRMRQSRTLPGSKFVLHPLLVFSKSPYPAIHF
jgi:hypothetical protein